MKTTLEMFKEIEDLEVAPDNEGEPLKSVKDIVPNWCNKIAQALKRLEAIDNANPSEALECLEDFIEDNKNSIEVSKANKYSVERLEAKRKELNTIKQALLKVQENTRSEEILQKYYQEGITLDSVRALREENTELRQKAQFLEEEYNNLMEDKDNLESELFKLATPKQYLKWEDLEFTKDFKCQKVKMNDNDYRIRYTLDDFGGKCCFLYDSARNHYIVLNKQFFNDLHLVRVEE